VTERTDAWHYKKKFVDKLEQTWARFRGLQPILIIVSRQLKLDRETRNYFNRRGIDVRVVRPYKSICS
jgi:riboflavin biosynthesis pyrimidine reductase